MTKQDLDKSQLDRQLLGDLAALIAVKQYVSATTVPAKYAARLAQIDAEIESLVEELWPVRIG